MKSLIITCSLLSALAFTGSAQTWYEVNVPTSAKLNDIDFASDLIGYIVGDSTTLLKTTNGGETWSKLNPTYDVTFFSNSVFMDVHFVSETIGYIVFGGATFGTLESTNGGQTWSLVENNSTNQCAPHSVYAFAENQLMVGGSDCFQGATINSYAAPNFAVQTVNYTTFDTEHYVKQMDFEANLGFAALNNEFMLRSDDFGQTWDTVNVGLVAGDVLTSVMIASNNTVYAGYNKNGSGFGVLLSTDGGLTWAEDFNSATFYYPAFFGSCEAGNSDVYMGAFSSGSETGLIFELSNGTWNYDNVDQAIYALDSYGTDVTFAVGDSGYVVVNQPISNIGVEELSIAQEELKLFPNPSNDFVTVSSTLGNLDWVEISDLHGTLVSRSPLSESNGVLNVSWLASGVYLIQTEMNGMRHIGRFVKQ